MGNKLKAYKVSPKYDFYSEVIFAETAGQAKSFALSMDSCSEYSFTELEVRRMPNLDEYVSEKFKELWDNAYKESEKDSGELDWDLYKQKLTDLKWQWYKNTIN